MIQETAAHKVKEVITQDIWGSVKDVLNWGLHLGSGDNKIHITVGTVLLIIISFIIFI